MFSEPPSSFKNIPPLRWVQPSTAGERDEFKRVAKKFAPEGQEQAWVETLMRKAETAELVELNEELWKRLKNTDSFKIQPGEFEKVHAFAEEYKRDDQMLLQAIQNGSPLEAPIILETPTELHLVSGNTRLMLARALAQRPKVILIA